MFEFLFPFASKVKSVYFEACTRGCIKFLETFRDAAEITAFDPADFGIMQMDHHVISQGCLERFFTSARIDTKWRNDAGNYGFHCAAQYGQTKLLEYMWEKGLFPGDSLDLANPITHATCLILAAMNGHIATVKFLVKAGANIDSQDHSGKTALHWAAQSHHLDIVEYLLSQGANPALRTRFNQTAAELTNDLQIRRAIRSYLDGESVLLTTEDKYHRSESSTTESLRTSLFSSAAPRSYASLSNAIDED